MTYYISLFIIAIISGFLVYHYLTIVERYATSQNSDTENILLALFYLTSLLLFTGYFVENIWCYIIMVLLVIHSTNHIMNISIKQKFKDICK